MLHPVFTSWKLLAAAGFAVTCLLARETQQAVEQRAADRTRLEAEQLKGRIVHTFEETSRPLFGARGLIAGSEDVTAEEWRAFLQAGQLANEAPALAALGYTKPGEPGVSSPDVFYLEPAKEAEKWRSALLAATERLRASHLIPAKRNSPVIVDVLSGERGASSRLHVLVVLPARGGKEARQLHPTETQEFVMGVFDVQQMLRAALDEPWRLGEYSIRDTSSPGTVLFATPGVSNGASILQSTLELGGKTWLLTASAPLPSTFAATVTNQLGTLLPGFVITALVAALVYSKQQTAVRADRLARSMTADLTAREEGLRESEERFQSFMDHSPSVSWMKDDQCRYVYVSKGMLNLLQRDESQILGKSDFDLWPAAVADQLRANDLTVLVSGEPLSVVENASSGSKASSQWLSHKFRFLRNGQFFVAGSAVEITERVSADERARTLFEHSSDAQLILEDTRIIDCNNAAVEMLRAGDKATLLALHPALLSPIRQSDGRLSADKLAEIDLLARERGYHRFEWTHKRLDGTQFPTEVTLTPVTLGGRDAVLVVWHDLTERKRIEGLLVAKERLLRQFVEHSPAAIAMFDVEVKYLVASKRWYEDYQIDGQSIIGRSHYDVFPDLPDRFKRLHAAILSGELASHAAEDCYERAGDQSIWLKWKLQPWRDEQERIAGLIMFTEVITARKRSEIALAEKATELATANARLAETTAFKSQFLANMSHEIRTPLTSIIGFTESALVDRLEEKERATALKTVLRNSRHLLSVINDILDLSKIEAGKLEIERASVSLTEVMSDVSKFALMKAREKGLSFHIGYEFPFPFRIVTDETRLKQILLNLVSNALKFTERGTVRIDARYDAAQKRVSFAVSDTGIGLSTEQIERIFKPFSQADTTTTRKFGGTGLGLVISSHLASELGGAILVESSPGDGSVFTVTVDTGVIDEADLRQSLPVPVEIALPSDSGVRLLGKVLVAEDGPDNQEFISLLLRKTGVTFVMVDDGAKAVDAASTEVFDLVLMDMQMPILDGLSATAELRKRGYKQPIVALTANSMHSDVQRCMDRGCTAFLGKPFSRADFFAMLSTYLQSSGDSAPGQLPRAVLAIDPDILPLSIRFLASLPERLLAIDQLIHRGDFELLEVELHRLAGAAPCYGFVEIGSVCKTMERAAIAGSSVALRSLSLKLASAYKTATSELPTTSHDGILVLTDTIVG